MVLGVFQAPFSSLCVVQEGKGVGASGQERAGKEMDTGRVGGQKQEVLWAEVNPVCTALRLTGFPSPSPALFLF